MQQRQFLCTQLGHKNREIIGFCLFQDCSVPTFCQKCIGLDGQKIHKEHQENFCLDFLKIIDSLEKQKQLLTDANLDIEDLSQKFITSQQILIKIFQFNLILELPIMKKISNIFSKLQKIKILFVNRDQALKMLLTCFKKEDFQFVMLNIDIIKKIFRKQQAQNKLLDKLLNMLSSKKQYFIQFYQVLNRFISSKQELNELLEIIEDLKSQGMINYEQGKKIFQHKIFEFLQPMFLNTNQLLLKQQNYYEHRPYLNCKNLFDVLEKGYQKQQTIVEQKIQIKTDNADLEAIAQVLISQRIYGKSIMRYDHLIKTNPDDYAAYDEKAQFLMRHEKYDEAIFCYDSYIKIKPNKYDAYEAKADVLIQQQKYDEALQCYESFIKIYPDNTEPQIAKGIVLIAKAQVLIQQKRYDEAILWYDSYIKLKPNECHIYEAIVLIQQQKYDEAIQYFDQSITINPNNYQAYEAKGIKLALDLIAQVLIQQQKYNEAIQCYDLYLKIKPNKSNVYKAKANVLIQQLKYDEAISCFDSSIKIHPKDYKVYKAKAQLLIQQQKYDEATKCYDSYIEKLPNKYEAFEAKAEVLIQQQKYDQAILCYDYSIQMHPNDYKAYKAKGIQLGQCGIAKVLKVIFRYNIQRILQQKYDEAIFCHIKHYPNDSKGYIEKAEALNELHQYDESIDCLSQYIEINPVYYNIYITKAKALWNQQKYIDSLICLEKFAQLGESQNNYQYYIAKPAYYINKCQVLMHLNIYDQALLLRRIEPYYVKNIDFLELKR